MGKKIPPPAPVTVVKFDDQGQPVSTEVVKPLPDYKKRLLGLPVKPKSEWEPDEITMTLRIMARSPRGENAVLCYAYRGNVEERLAKAKADHPECEVWSEPMPSKKPEETEPDATTPRSRGSKSTMTDEDARRVKFGDMSNMKVSEAAKALGLSYGQVYSAKNGYTFKHITG